MHGSGFLQWILKCCLESMTWFIIAAFGSLESKICYFCNISGLNYRSQLKSYIENYDFYIWYTRYMMDKLLHGLTNLSIYPSIMNEILLFLLHSGIMLIKCCVVACESPQLITSSLLAWLIPTNTTTHQPSWKQNFVENLSINQATMLIMGGIIYLLAIH